MAQQNRRRSRRGGNSSSPKSGNGRPANGVEPEFPELGSGEEQLSEAQMALGRPAPEETPSPEELASFEESDAERDRDPSLSAAPAAGALSTRPTSRRRDRHPDTDGDGDASGQAVAERTGRMGIAGQLVGFSRGSYRELQRVQWPDRRQVFQATGVVLGFVIVAGAFLGVASWAAQKIVNLILYGHG